MPFLSRTMRCNPPSRRAKLLSLFETLARGRQDFPLRGLDAAQVDWIVRSGLGPLCFHAAKELLENSISPHWSSLKAADLTARMIGGEHLDAMREIIDASAGCVPRLTLLKGISVAAECYPEFHLRPMRDIDFLIPEEYLARMEDLLRSLGYKQTCGERPEFYRTHHHLMPFFHEEKRVWVEVHHHLLSTQNRASRDPVFGLSNVLGQLRRSRFQNREIYRLSIELQLVYLAAHWAQDFKSIGGMIAAMDLIYLLNHRGGRLR